jgi:hypothetical protein
MVGAGITPVTRLQVDPGTCATDLGGTGTELGPTLGEATAGIEAVGDAQVVVSGVPDGRAVPFPGSVGRAFVNR